jgi:hypothetical protein
MQSLKSCWRWKASLSWIQMLEQRYLITSQDPCGPAGVEERWFTHNQKGWSDTCFKRYSRWFLLGGCWSESSMKQSGSAWKMAQRYVKFEPAGDQKSDNDFEPWDVLTTVKKLQECQEQRKKDGWFLKPYLSWRLNMPGIDSSECCCFWFNRGTGSACSFGCRAKQIYSRVWRKQGTNFSIIRASISCFLSEWPF